MRCVRREGGESVRCVRCELREGGERPEGGWGECEEGAGGGWVVGGGGGGLEGCCEGVLVLLVM